MLDRILAFIASKLSVIGQTYTAAWTATSTASWAARCTGSITLPAGKYIVFVKTPFFQNGNEFLNFGLDGFDFAESASLFGSQDMRSFMLTLPASKTTYVTAQFSASKSYSYIERGGLKAIRIA